MGRPFWLALIAAIGAAVAWGISQPFLPYTPVSSTQIESHFTLGTFYGWFNNLLLGVLVCGPLSFLIAEPRTTPAKALLCGLTGAAIGGGFVCGADAFSDFVGIKAAKSGIPEDLMVILWHVLVASAMAFAIALACTPTPKRLLRALVAAGIGAAGSFVLRLVLLPVEVIFLVGKAMNSTPGQIERMNSWAVYSPSELIQNVAMAVVMGLVLGFVEYFGRDAWLRLYLGRNEGRDYPLERQVTRIGSGEGAEVMLRGDPGILPFHAHVTEQQGVYSVSAMAGAVSVNGYPVQSAPLQSGDMIDVGGSRLTFLRKTKKSASRTNHVPAVPRLEGPPPVMSAPQPPTAIPPPAAPAAGATLEWAGGLTKMLAAGSNLLGRDPDSVVNLMNDQSVSRRHAEIVIGSDSAVLRDAGSRNGTSVNGEPVTGDRVLQDGDVIQIGSTRLTFRS
ncbi:MAG: FHA domain-containing protein [Fimbriimonadales bacterium]